MSIVRAPKPRADWIPEGRVAFLSMAEGRDALKLMESGHWKWARPPGDGKTQARFECTAHLDCGRINHAESEVNFDGSHYIIEGCGVHSLDPCCKKRSNSTLTRAMERRVRESMDQGGRSAGLYDNTSGTDQQLAVHLRSHARTFALFDMPFGFLHQAEGRRV